MACFPNKNCGGCDHFVKTTSVALSPGVVTYTLPNQKLRNGDKLCVCLAQTVPAFSGIPPVMRFSINGQVFNASTVKGNAVYADQVCARNIYTFVVATDTHIMAYMGCKRLHCTDAAMPIINVPVPVDSAVETKGGTKS